MPSKHKTIRSISLSRECQAVIEENFTYGEFSKWVEERIFETFTSDREKIEKELEEINKKKMLLEAQLKERNELNIKEIEFMKNAKERLDRNAGFIDGILRQYYNLFGIMVTKKYFYKRMKEALQL